MPFTFILLSGQREDDDDAERKIRRVETGSLSTTFLFKHYLLTARIVPSFRSEYNNKMLPRNTAAGKKERRRA